MDPGFRARRAAILCCHCVRKAAYYAAGSEFRAELAHDFWRNVHGNFLDVAVLEWCKIFADEKGKYHWSKLAPDPQEFEKCLLLQINVPRDVFDEHVKKCKTYRDKFIAHLDDHLVMHLPTLKIIVDSTIFIFGMIKQVQPDVLHDAPNDLHTFYSERLAVARASYLRLA